MGSPACPGLAGCGSHGDYCMGPSVDLISKAQGLARGEGKPPSVHATPDRRGNNEARPGHIQ